MVSRRQPQARERKRLTAAQADVHRLPGAPLVEASGWNQASLRLAEHRRRVQRFGARVDRRRPASLEPERVEAPDRRLQRRLLQRQLDEGDDLLRGRDVEARLDSFSDQSMNPKRSTISFGLLRLNLPHTLTGAYQLG